MVTVNPVSEKDRIAVLRGISILGIFFLNILYMGNTIFWQLDPRLLGWSGSDRATFAFLTVFLDGTKRGLFQLLFGATVVILSAPAMRRDAPVEIADSYYRRYIWLLLFGLFDVFVVAWDGDFLHPYAIAALFLFPLRRLHPGLLFVLGLSLTIGIAAVGSVDYSQRAALQTVAESATAASAHHVPLTPAQDAAAKQWTELQSSIEVPKAMLDAEREAHADGPVATWTWLREAWFDLQQQDWLSFDIFRESITTMLIGMAFFCWGIMQGLRTRRFYMALLLVGYGFGLAARAIDVTQLMTFSPVPRLSWITSEGARLAVTIGHLALINLIFTTAPGKRLLQPFKAAGRLALSLYFTESLVGMWLLFSRLGLNLWAHFGWAKLTCVAVIVGTVLLVAANLWMRFFVMGPFEWLWRSLTHCRPQPFRRSALAQGKVLRI